MVKAIVNVDPVSLIRLGLLLTLLLMTINLNNSASGSIPPSDGLCPLISWILISMVFILVALFEYFLILVLLRFGNKVSLLPGCVTALSGQCMIKMFPWTCRFQKSIQFFWRNFLE